MRGLSVFFDLSLQKAFEQTVELPVNKDVMTLVWRHYYARQFNFTLMLFNIPPVSAVGRWKFGL